MQGWQGIRTLSLLDGNWTCGGEAGEGESQ